MCYSWDLGLLLLFCRMQSSRTAPVNIFKKYGLWPSHTQHAINIKFIRFLSIKISHFAFFPCFLHFWPLFFPPFLYLSREVGINFHPRFLSQTSHALKDKFTLWESEEAGDYWSWLPCFLFFRLCGSAGILYHDHSPTPIHPQRICVEPGLCFPRLGLLLVFRRNVNFLSCYKPLGKEFCLPGSLSSPVIVALSSPLLRYLRLPRSNPLQSALSCRPSF